MGKKNSYDRQFVRCGVDENKNTKIGKFCTTQHENTLTETHQFPLAYLLGKQKQTKKSFIVCLLVVYFPFPVQMKPPKVTLLTFYVPPLGLKGAREKTMV